MYCLQDTCGEDATVATCDEFEFCNTFNQCNDKPCTESVEGSENLDTCIETGICIDGVCAECSTESGLPESCGSGLYCNDLGAFKFCENTCNLDDTCV